LAGILEQAQLTFFINLSSSWQCFRFPRSWRFPLLCFKFRKPFPNLVDTVPAPAPPFVQGAEGYRAVRLGEEGIDYDDGSTTILSGGGESGSDGKRTGLFTATAESQS
jgi:hypothetical protein